MLIWETWAARGGNFGGGQGDGQMERGQRPEGFEGEPPEDLKQESPSL